MGEDRGGGNVNVTLGELQIPGGRAIGDIVGRLGKAGMAEGTML